MIVVAPGPASSSNRCIAAAPTAAATPPPPPPRPPPPPPPHPPPWRCWAFFWAAELSAGLAVIGRGETYRATAVVKLRITGFEPVVVVPVAEAVVEVELEPAVLDAVDEVELVPELAVVPPAPVVADVEAPAFLVVFCGCGRILPARPGSPRPSSGTPSPG